MGGLGSLWACLLFAHHGFAVGVLTVCSPWVCSLLVCCGFAHHGPWVLAVGLGLGLAHSGGACGLLFVYLFIIIIFFLVLNVEC